MLSGMSPGQRSRLFQEVNDRIYDLLASADAELPGEFFCECGRDCGQRVTLSPPAFAMLRDTDALVLSSDCRGQGLQRKARASLAGGVPVLG
jgi:hypothetical protein